MRIGILLFEDVEELDAVGPWEVFGMWERLWPGEIELLSLARTAGPVKAAKGLKLLADHGFADVGGLDVLVHPGGKGTRPLVTDEEHLEWVRGLRAGTPLMTSVCTGALVYAAAGLLKDRPATTHWGAVERLAALDPTIEVRENARFVDDGDMVTSAGVSAGIDMSLHLVARLSTKDRAREIRRYMQYDPEPPV